jgi:hypothetical protein
MTPQASFNSSLEGNTRRAIDFHEGDKIDEKALKALVRAAAAVVERGAEVVETFPRGLALPRHA